MATITKSIGVSGRDYSTITAWEADLDNTGIYASGDDVVGECYNDSTFTDQAIIDGGGTVGLNSIELTAASADRHDGTAGTGVVIGYNGSVNFNSPANSTCSWLEIDWGGTSGGSPNANLIQSNNNNYTYNFSNLLVHDAATGSSIIGIYGRYGYVNATNNIVYNLTHTSAYTGNGIYCASYRDCSVYNNTVYNIDAPYPTPNTNFGIQAPSGRHDVKNNISLDIDTAVNNHGCFNTYPHSGVSHNLASDLTAIGVGVLVNKSAADQFVSIVGGSEDLHLKTTADAVGAGEDLGSTPAGVQYDIDGVDRTLRDLAWDIGADQVSTIVVKTIGTSSRDYSTIQAWEADLDDAGLYQSGDDSVGECYNDSTFTQTDNLRIRSGGVVGLNSVTLTAATTDRHDGTAGTGAEIGVASMKRIYMQAGYNASVSIKNVVSWLDINGQGYGRTSLFSFYTANDELKNCICRSVGDQVTPPSNCYNNIIYIGGAFIYGANYGISSAANVLNNTVYGVNRGITVSLANSNVSIKNNICAGTSIVDFDGNYGDVGYGVPQVSNNLSSDATAPGTDSLINKSASNQFVSIIGGSEDLHLASGSDAIAAGVDLGSNLDGVQYDIDGYDRDAGDRVWDIGADQAIGSVVKTIGTAGRDYSTMTSWEAGLDSVLYQTGDDAIGEAYNDSNFIYNHEGVNGGQLTINGGTFSGLNSVTLTVPSSDRHDGTLGTGTTILANGTTSKETVEAFIDNCTIEWLSIEVDGYSSYSNGVGIYYHLNRISGGYTSGGTIRNNIVRGENQPKAVSGSGNLIAAAAHEVRVTNNIVFNGYNSTDSSGVGIGTGYGNTAQYIYNNTVYNCGTNILSSASNPIFKNNLAVGKQGTSDFSITSSSSHSNNLSSDGTADDYGGTDHVVDVVTANQFVSTVSGSEDLHILSTSDAFGAGADLGTTPDGVQYDIDGVDRDARGLAWDIGADQAPATITKTIGSASRDYSTITAWEAALDSNVYQSGDDAVGECYNDSTFSTNNVIINGGSTVGLSSITLGVATGERHDGTAGTGAILEKDSLWHNLLSVSTTVETLVTDLEISSTYVTANGVIAVGAHTYDHRFSKLLIYASAGATGAIGAGFWRVVVDNCIMYGAINGGIGANTYYSPCEFVNNTIYCPNPIGNPGDRTISKAIIKNNIAFSTNATNSINNTGATSHPDWQNNLVNVGPNYGSNQYTETSSANLFVSTVSGSEDLHLNSTSTAIGEGANLSSQAGLSAFNTHPEYVAGFSALDIDGVDRIARGAAWDIGADQAPGTVTKTIGSASRDYSTITAWEAALDSNIYQSDDDVVGECYNDSTFVEGFTIDGGSTVGLNSILLIPATGERHDGTADTGVKVQTLSYGAGSQYRLWTTTPTLELRYIEIERNVNSEQGLVSLTYDNVFNAGILRQSTGSPNRGMVGMGFGRGYLYNSILYGVTGQGVSVQPLYGATPEIINNTIVSPNSYCLYARDRANGQANAKIKNNILIANGTAVAVDPGGTVPTSFPDYANNITNYSSFPNGLASLSDHITDIDETQQFVSTVSGSEDYHLASTSDAIGAGEDIVATKSSTTNSYYLENTQYDIDGVDRDARGAAWDIGADQAAGIVTKSIGTSSRDYSTIQAWEADLDSAGYQYQDDAVGECYDDSTFNTAGININGGLTVGLSSVKLSVAESERHDGTLFTGVHINPTYSLSYIIATSRSNTIIEWLTLKTNGASTYSHGAMIIHDIYSSNTISRYMVLQGEDQVYPSQTPIGIRTGGHENIAHNNIIYGIANGSVGGGIYDSYRRCNAYNNTIYGCNYGYYATQQGTDTRNVKNNLNIGNNYDFYADGTLGYVSSNNASSDSTATVLGGSNHVTGVSASNQFISTVSGSEDLHLETDADVIGAGVDLGSTIEGLQYDIDGVDRDARGTTWDIGADQAAGVVVKTIGSAGRDYSTITAWEAALDDTSIYQSSDDAVGECYNDSDFDESPTIDGGATVALNSRTIKVADGEKHDGTVGTGVRLLNSTSATKLFSTQAFANGFVTRISGLEVDNNARFSVTYAAIRSVSPVRADVIIDNCITHNTTGLANVRGFEITNSWYNDVSINNCIAYNIGVTSGGNSVANGFYAYGSRMDILNCVAYKITSTVNVYGRGYQAHHANATGGHELKNSISMGCEVDIIGFNANGHTNTNCLTSDATADGTGGIINKTASDQFVSTVAGSEDLHLLKTADAVGAGADLSSYTTTSDGNDTFSAIDVNGSNRAAFTGTAWDIGAHQYALTASIGTSSRDYSTIAAWEADLDNTAKYGNGSNAVGECYNDSTFAAGGIIDGGGTVGLNSVELTVANGEHHDGTAGTGAKIVSQANYQGISGGNTLPVHVSLLEVDYNSFRVGIFGGNGGSGVNQYSRLLLHNGYLYTHMFYYDYSSMDIFNNIIFDLEGGNRGQFAIRTTSSAPSYIVNNTIHDIRNNGNGYYLRIANTICKNCIGTSIGSSAFAHGSSPITSNNLSSDATADDGVGTGHIINVDPVKQFISTTPGSEDLHLVMGSDALNVGADLGNTPEGVQYDIDGYDRTASITWDIGADEAHEIDGEFGYKGFLSYLNRTTLRAG